MIDQDEVVSQARQRARALIDRIGFHELAIH